MSKDLLAPRHRFRPYWWDEADLSALCESPSELPDKADVAIVGGGYSGLSAALTLARAGRSVVVMDADWPGFGCSSRNGGLVGPSFHKLGLKGLAAAHGEAKAHEILVESMETLDHLKRFIEEEAIECHFRPSGRFRGAIRPEHYDNLGRELESLRQAVGLEADMVSRPEQSAEIGSEAYHGGAVYHRDGHLQPALYAKGLIELAKAAGARLFGKAKVHAIDRDEPAGFSLSVADRKLAARDVLIVTNGYTGKELKPFRRRLIPLRSAIIATESLEESLAKGLSPRNRSLGDTSRLVLYYRLSPDGRRMVFGGRAFDMPDRPLNYTADLYKQMTRIFPQLIGAKITHAWSGTVAFTFDHAPHLGQLDGLWYSMGYCGSGVGRATYFGRKVALKILGDPEGRSALDDLAFESRPFYTGVPWFLPALIRWHAVADRLGF